jgi:hypothetical protein
MLILIFVVSFGPKKGTTLTYFFFWSVLFYQHIKHFKTYFNGTQLVRFQYSIVTSRPTIYLLFLFWCFFTFSGELLLLIIFNYNNLSDLTPSTFFSINKITCYIFT